MMALVVTVTPNERGFQGTPEVRVFVGPTLAALVAGAWEGMKAEGNEHLAESMAEHLHNDGYYEYATGDEAEGVVIALQLVEEVEVLS
jgi:hypothetical protein